MYLGATVWPFCWQGPYHGALRQIAELGLISVELIAWPWTTYGRLPKARA